MNEMKGKDMYAKVFVDIPALNLDKPLVYKVPSDMWGKVFIGSVVKVPIRGRRVDGYVVDLLDFPPPLKKEVKIKDIEEVISANSLWNEEMLKLARWMEEYYLTTFVSALKTIIPSPIRESMKVYVPKRVKKVILSRVPSEEEFLVLQKKAPSQYKILQYLMDKKGEVCLSHLIRGMNFSSSSVYALEKKGFVRVFEGVLEERYFHPFTVMKGERFVLTDYQRKAFERLLDLYRSKSPEVALLHGVTGSGKTEVYLRLIEEVIKDGKEALVLVPEISLTPQIIERFYSRFGDNIAVLHSRLSNGERQRMWWSIKKKKVQVVLGVRSAVFAPLENIGVIVVDEEHEPSYKQEKEPRYHAKHIAMMRGIYHQALVVLGSATPSLEVYHRAMEGKYYYIEIPHRIGSSGMPDVEIVNLKDDIPKKRNGRKVIGNTLLKALEEVVQRGEQAILFLNRRGFSPFLLCHDCGKTIPCPYCDITLTFHKRERLLKCHYCNYKREAPEVCPFCGGNRLKMPSFGIQRVEEELEELFPRVKYIRMDRDTTRFKDSHYILLKQFAQKKATFLIGTQMIAKGLDFPHVTLVGVILADVSFYIPDFTSIERSYQILTQVAGRAGRGEKSGKVIIQTYNPNIPVLKAVSQQNFSEFASWELNNRRILKYPPFSHIVNIIFSGTNSAKVEEYSIEISNLLKRKEFKKVFYAVLGSSPSPISRVKSKYRWHITIKGEKVLQMNRVIRAVLKKVSPPSGVSVSVDVDPISLM